ncbi:PREDICTED: G2/mitotic-specific cyclin S13-7 isoform X2 [Nelumbo nucifera]|uniref:G2/mitotic-specific cyclin S13-7 isoform X2 n=1 Tax=Nelumbo nucifera TaxID=4432 RepID=A0A1U7ZFZ2_NELNU|nr:PREDICTED: G2/mitotic-specific cyclin S13-7 isoform X2 [Nelumbo nucifera]
MVHIGLQILKKPPAVLVDGAVAAPKGVAAAKPARKKVSVKPTPDTGMEISPKKDVTQTKEGTKKESSISQRSSRKKIQTLTSILTARSKAACGIADKPKEPSFDIDSADTNNHLAVVDYVEDIYKFYKLEENASRVHDYMHSQPDINEKMRSILVDWLIEVHYKFELRPETLYLTIHVIDRFLSMKAVPRRELQLLGIGAMLIASKYEEIWAPEVNDLVLISDRAYSREQILAMEKAILGKLEWTLTVPTPYVFLVRFIKAASDEKMENMIFFMAELGLMHYETIRYCPSMVAASAVYAAQCTLNKSPLWSETLKFHTGFSESQLMDCAKLLVHFHSIAAESKLRAVYKKYSDPQRGAVALLPPAKNLLTGVIH